MKPTETDECWEWVGNAYVTRRSQVTPSTLTQTYGLIEPSRNRGNRQLLLVQARPWHLSSFSPSLPPTKWRIQRGHGYLPRLSKTPTQTALPIRRHARLHLRPQSQSSPTKQPYINIPRHILPDHVPSFSLRQAKRQPTHHCLPSPRPKRFTRLIRQG